MEWTETITIIGTMCGIVMSALLVLRSDIKQSEKRMVAMIHHSEEQAQSDVATLRGEIRQSEERTAVMIQQGEERAQSDVAMLRGEIRQSEERTVAMIQQSEKRTVAMIQQSEERTAVMIQQGEERAKSDVAMLRGEIRQSEERTVAMIQQGEERTHQAIKESEKRQDELRVAELQPIKEQIYNHIPTQIGEVRSIIVEYIAKGAANSKNSTPPQKPDDTPATPQ